MFGSERAWLHQVDVRYKQANGGKTVRLGRASVRYRDITDAGPDAARTDGRARPR